MKLKDRNGDDWTVSDGALYATLGAVVALIIVGGIAMFAKPATQQTAERQLHNTQQTVPGAQPGSTQGTVSR